MSRRCKRRRTLRKQNYWKVTEYDEDKLLGLIIVSRSILLAIFVILLITLLENV
jgi:hypothetical protein